MKKIFKTIQNLFIQDIRSVSQKNFQYPEDENFLNI